MTAHSEGATYQSCARSAALVSWPRDFSAINSATNASQAAAITTSAAPFVAISAFMTPATAAVRVKPRISNWALGTLLFGWASGVYFLAIGRIGGNLESELEAEANRQAAEEQSRRQ